MQKIQEQQLQEQQRQQQQMEQQRLQKQQEVEQQQQRLLQEQMEQQRLQQQKQQEMEQQRLLQEQIEQQRFQQQQQQVEERRRKEEQDRLEQQQQQQQIHQRYEETKQLRRSQTPSLTRRATFEPINQTSGFKKVDSHFGQVKTGHVHEKRSFWMRSMSTDKINHEMSPGPRRRRVTGGQDWIKQSSDDRPGSSLGQVIGNSQTGESSAHNVKAVVSGWSDLSKSKSSAAVLQEREKRPRRSQSRERMREFIPVTAAQNQAAEQT